MKLKTNNDWNKLGLIFKIRDLSYETRTNLI